ncbi:hypothetical protein ACF053_27420 [Streptomyces kanasensis]|uniref:hypothetical protein n=1 Tax=Streptomyces kanasensis TaxID=936756 RepID=UPI0036F72525
MSRTTPVRPVDVEAVFPALAAHRRTTTRPHPRRGAATAEQSSVAGPRNQRAGKHRGTSRKLRLWLQGLIHYRGARRRLSPFSGMIFTPDMFF